MNTNDIINTIRPILQEKLQLAANNDNTETQEDVFEKLARPKRDNAAPTLLIPAHGNRQAGSTPIAQAASEVFSFPRLDNRLATVSTKDLLRHNPEPEFGIFRPQEVDTEFLSFFTSEAKGRDKQLSKIQREIYVTMRPLFVTLQFLETNDLQSEISESCLQAITRKLQDTIALSFHAAEGVRIERRIALAKSANWGASLLEACEKVDSSAADDADLFGPEIRQIFHNEAKARKHFQAISSSNTNTPRSRPFPNNYRGGRGRGYVNKFGNSDRRSTTSFRSWSKGQGGGASAAATSERSPQTL
jgi:hypothetical protein